MEDRSHRPHDLHATLSSAEEVIVVELRKSLLLPLDDLLVVIREFIQPCMSRSAPDRCLRRNGISNLKNLFPEEEGRAASWKAFKSYDPGFIHADIKYLPQMPDELLLAVSDCPFQRARFIQEQCGRHLRQWEGT